MVDLMGMAGKSWKLRMRKRKSFWFREGGI